MKINKSSTYIVIILGCLVLAFAVFTIVKKNTPDSTSGSTHTVVLTAKGFEPHEVHIQKGDSVTFSSTRGFSYWPASDKHPSHSIYPDFDPEHAIPPEDTWKFQFNKEGAWSYHDHLNSTLRGVVYVSE